MCYLLSISEQIPGIFRDIDELVYEKFQLNISYRLYTTGYCTAYIEYEVTDPYKDRKLSIHGTLTAMSTYVEQIHHDINTLLYFFINHA